jgi:hypothetical protein
VTTLALGLVALSVLASDSMPVSPALPTLAVMNLEARVGVSADVADLLTGNFTETLRQTGRFERVVSAKEVQSVISLETQKQVANCDSQTCIAEVAGALGVDLLVFGSVGRVGCIWLFNASLVEARTGRSRGSLSRPLDGDGEDVLLRSMDGLVRELLDGPGTVLWPKVASGNACASSAPAAPAPPLAPSPTPVAAPQPVTPEGGNSFILPGRVGLASGIAALGLVGASVVVAVAAGLAAGVLWTTWSMGVVQTYGTGLGPVLTLAYLALCGVSGASVVGALGWGAASLASFVVAVLFM